MSYLGFEFKLDSEANSYALLSNGKIVRILNIIEEQMEVKLIGQTFSSQKDFYTYPCKSSDLDIYKVSTLSDDYTWVKLEDIKRKCMAKK